MLFLLLIVIYCLDCVKAVRYEFFYSRMEVSKMNDIFQIIPNLSNVMLTDEGFYSTTGGEMICSGWVFRVNDAGPIIVEEHIDYPNNDVRTIVSPTYTDFKTLMRDTIFFEQCSVFSRFYQKSRKLFPVTSECFYVITHPPLTFTPGLCENKPKSEESSEGNSNQLLIGLGVLLSSILLALIIFLSHRKKILCFSESPPDYNKAIKNLSWVPGKANPSWVMYIKASIWIYGFVSNILLIIKMQPTDCDGPLLRRCCDGIHSLANCPEDQILRNVCDTSIDICEGVNQMWKSEAISKYWVRWLMSLGIIVSDPFFSLLHSKIAKDFFEVIVIYLCMPVTILYTFIYCGFDEKAAGLLISLDNPLSSVYKVIVYSLIVSSPFSWMPRSLGWPPLYILITTILIKTICSMYVYIKKIQ